MTDMTLASTFMRSLRFQIIKASTKNPLEVHKKSQNCQYFKLNESLDISLQLQ